MNTTDSVDTDSVDTMNTAVLTGPYVGDHAGAPRQPSDPAHDGSAKDGASEEPSTAVGIRSRWPRIVALVVAALVLCSGLFAWWQTSQDDAIAQSQTRDAVLVATTQNIKTMNTLDYRKVDAGLLAWAAVTTGTLHDQLTGISAEDRKLLADQKKISTGKVVDAAVVDLGDTSATVIASVEITVKDDAHPDAKATIKRNRFSANLTKVGGLWKLENLQQVAVNLQ